MIGLVWEYVSFVLLENFVFFRVLIYYSLIFCVMDFIKVFSKMGMFKGLFNCFDGGVEVFDDLDDYWIVKSYKVECKFVIEDL